MRYCFTDVIDGNQFRVAKLIENDKGYYPLTKANPDDPHELDKFVCDQDHVRAIVDNFNKRLGVDRDTEMEIKFSTF